VGVLWIRGGSLAFDGRTGHEGEGHLAYLTYWRAEVEGDDDPAECSNIYCEPFTCDELSSLDLNSAIPIRNAYVEPPGGVIIAKRVNVCTSQLAGVTPTVAFEDPQVLPADKRIVCGWLDPEGVWQFAEPFAGWSPSIALDPYSGLPCIAYVSGDQDVVCASFNGTSWTHQS